MAAAPQPPPTTTSGNGSTSSGAVPAATETAAGKTSTTTPSSPTPITTGAGNDPIVIVATAHGKSSDHELVFYYPAGLENTRYRTKVAVKISVLDSTRPWHFECFVNDTLSAETNSTTTSVELMPQVGRTYSVRCSAKIGGSVANSTPAYASNEALSSNIVTVQIIEDGNKKCRARLGKGCYGSAREGVLGLNNPTSVQNQSCAANKICLRSGVTVASIRHDRCCSRTEKGLMCSNNESLFGMLVSDATIVNALANRQACTRCFIQATCDIRQFLVNPPLKYRTTFVRACEPYPYASGSAPTDPDQPHERCESDAISNATDPRKAILAPGQAAFKAFPDRPMVIGEWTYDVTTKYSTERHPDLSPKVIEKRP